jgi:hypothetical protein
MSLAILTKSPAKSFTSIVVDFKTMLKFVFGRKRGPDMVNESLRKGLNELGVDWLYNPSITKIKKEDTVFVNTSVEALRWAIDAKENGYIKHLVVGPNIVMYPSGHEGIMMNIEIDRILFPAQWTKDYWVSLEPGLKEKIYIWPAGVGVSNAGVKKGKRVLVYFKKAPKTVLDRVETFLKQGGISYDVIRYGQYEQASYFSLLDSSKLAIFLSESESQGLALFEAWAHNVPTLVWNRGYWSFGDRRWEDKEIAAPYLTDRCGMFFHEEEDFGSMYTSMVERLSEFDPQQYVREHFTHKKIAENFMQLISFDKNDK